MVEQALNDPNQFSAVIREVLPTLLKIAHRYIGRDCDDAIQDATVRIWRNLSKCNLLRPATAKSWVISVGANVIRDHSRHHRGSPVQLTSDILVHDPSSGLDEDRCDDVLRAYLEDVRNTGVVSHASVGRKAGHSRSRMQTLFYESARKYRDGE